MNISTQGIFYQIILCSSIQNICLRRVVLFYLIRRKLLWG
nr:MAG TPA: hypothetical protein [Caudoviricetes sp.]